MTTQNCHSGIKSADIESLDLGLFHSLLDKRLEIEGVLCCDDLFKYGLCLGVLGSEYSAAVLVWLDGYIKCIYLSCYFNYLALVHADNGTEYRHTAGIVGAYDSAHGLACNLTNALSCNEGGYAVFSQILWAISIIRRRMMMVNSSSGQLSLKASCISVKGTQ